MPKALQDQPDLEPELRFVWELYHRLSRSREWGESGPQPIQVSEFFAYCDGVGIAGLSFREWLLDVIQDMDGTFLEHQAATQKAAMAKTASSDVVPPAA